MENVRISAWDGRLDLHVYPTYIINMKAIQIMMDEGLLREIDSDEEVVKSGRSAFFRKIAADYLRRRRRAWIVREYRAAYASSGDADSDLEGWEEEGVWPQE
jgi:hypothetical protein